MNYGSGYQIAITDSLTTLYTKLALVLPNLVAAIVILILGWIIGSFLSQLVKKFLLAIRIDQAANQLGLQNLSSKTGKELSFAAFGAWIVKWFFFIASIIAAADILNLHAVTNFLYVDVLGFAGRVIIAMAILLLGILAADFFSGVVSTSVRASGLASASVLTALTRWAILVFSVIAALYQLQIAADFLQDLFRALVAMFAIAGGLAFGLGGRDHAKKVLDEMEQSLTRKS